MSDAWQSPFQWGELVEDFPELAGRIGRSYPVGNHTVNHLHLPDLSDAKVRWEIRGAQTEIIARYGCPLGSLCSELDKREARPGLPVAELMRVPIAWAEAQFKSLGREDARDLAIDLMAAYEGSALLANTLRDPDVLTSAAHRLDRWIDAL